VTGQEWEDYKSNMSDEQIIENLKNGGIIHKGNDEIYVSTQKPERIKSNDL